MGIRKYFESPYRPGERLQAEEYYRWIFENSVPGLPEAARRDGLDPLGYMRKWGAFEIERGVYNLQEAPESIDGRSAAGFPTPSRKLEFYSKTMKDWGWPEHALPGYIPSHVNWPTLDRENGEFVLIPTFRVPTMIHTRSANAKWLAEISHTNPLWMHTSDANRMGLHTGDLVKVTTEIGHFVVRVWVTEGIRPGVVACSHHFGRWRVTETEGTDRWLSSLVGIEEGGDGTWRFRRLKGVEPFTSEDPDSRRIWWHDGGVHQNLAYAPHPDPLSGQNCWNQRVRLEPAGSDDRYGDIFVDTRKSFALYKEWLALTRPAPGPDNLRRPLWFQRPFRPKDSAFYFKK